MCEPTWSGCVLADSQVIELDVPAVLVNSAWPAPDGGVTVVWGDLPIETDFNGMLRVGSDGETVWQVDVELGIVAATTAQDGAMLLFGRETVAGSLVAYDSEGTIAWSRGMADAPELEDADCPILAHDPALGWIAGCVVPTRVGGDGIYRLHTYDDAGALLDSVEIPGEWPSTMHATGDGHVVISGVETEPRAVTLTRIEVATGAVDWVLELDGTDAPRFAVGTDGTLAVRADSELLGIDPTGEVVWMAPLAGEDECFQAGASPEIAAAGDGFVTAGLQSFTANAIVHHHTNAGMPLCADAPQVPTATVTANQPVWMASAGAGAWVVGSEPGNRAQAHRIWLLRTTAP